MSDGILSRWARRKQAVRAAERAEATPPVAEEAVLPAAAAEALPGTTEEADALADAIARLPKLEDLTAQTDLTEFLRTGIPSALRNAALRRMWSIDPAIRDFVSEAREYAYDWNTPGGVPGLGPMLPTDDIKAMVERVMTGHAPALAQAEPDLSEVDADAEPELESMAEMDIAATETPALPETETPRPAPSPEPVISFQSPAIVSRLRRHGGAMPG